MNIPQMFTSDGKLFTAEFLQFWNRTIANWNKASSEERDAVFEAVKESDRKLGRKQS